MPNQYTGRRTTSVRGDFSPYPIKYNPIGEQVIATADKLTEDRKESMRQLNIMMEGTRKMKVNEADRPILERKVKEAQAYINNNLFRPDEVMRVAGQLISDPEILARERANTEYEERLRSIESNNRYNEVTKARWKDQNKYNFKATKFDEDGNIVGGELQFDSQHWSGENAAPVDDKTDYEMVQEIANIAAPSMTSSQRGSKSAITNANGTGSASESSSGSSVKELSYNKLVETKKAYFSQGSAGWNAMEQRFQNLRWQRDNLKARLNDPTLSTQERARIQEELNKCNVIYKDNNPEGPELGLSEYIDKTVDPLLQQMAYRHTESSSFSGSSRNKQASGGGGGGINFNPVINVGDSNKNQYNPSGGGNYTFGTHLVKTRDGKLQIQAPLNPGETFSNDGVVNVDE